MFAVERDPTTGHDAVQVGMMGHGRAPGVKHGCQAEPSAEVFGIGADGEQGVGGGLEQKVVDERLVVIGDVGDRGREGEHDVEVGDR